MGAAVGEMDAELGEFNRLAGTTLRLDAFQGSRTTTEDPNDFFVCGTLCRKGLECVPEASHAQHGGDRLLSDQVSTIRAISSISNSYPGGQAPVVDGPGILAEPNPSWPLKAAS